MKTTTLITTGLVSTLLAATAVAQRAPQRAPQRAATLAPAAAAALNTALVSPSGEYAAFATYQAVIDKLGPVQPFVNILNAEARHISALTTQLQKYGLPVPANPWTKIEVPNNLADAALLGIQVEEDNAAMYDELAAAVAAYPDLVRVFTQLQSASEDKHLTAFEDAADGTYTATTCPLGTPACGLPGACGMAGKGRGNVGAGQGPRQGCGNGQRVCDGTGPQAGNGTCPRQLPATAN